MFTLNIPGFRFKITDSNALERILITSRFQYVIPKPVKYSEFTSIPLPEVQAEMHYLDDDSNISMSYNFIHMLHSQHGDHYFEVLCSKIEKMYQERYKAKPDYVIEYIMKELQAWLSMGFKQFMENQFYPAKKDVKSMEQALQEYVMAGIVSEKYVQDYWSTALESTTVWQAVDSTKAAGVGRELERLSYQLPGVLEYVKPICTCASLYRWSNVKNEVQLWRYIQHLNDAASHTVVDPNAESYMNVLRDPYTREEIADWLETLDIDIRFKTPERIRDEQD